MKYYNLPKRGLALFVALMMCLSLLPTSAFALDTCNGDYHTCSNYARFDSDENSHWGVCDCGQTVTSNKKPHEDNGDGKCSVCGRDLSSSWKPVCDHNWSKVEHNNTTHWNVCTLCGEKDLNSEEKHSFTDGKCSCGYEDTSYQPPHTHSYVTPKYDEKSHWYECSCGTKTSEAEHSFTDGECSCGYEDPNYQPSQTPSDSECPDSPTGEHIYVYKDMGEYHIRMCYKCDFVPSDNDDKDHNWEVTSNKAGTCESKSETTYTCKQCSATKTEYGDYGRHVCGEFKWSDTTHWDECSVCHKKINEKAHEKGNVLESVEATCEGKGYVRYECNVPNCGYDHIYENKAPLGHDYKLEYTKAATCEESGYEEYKCTRCGDDYQKVLPATDHDWSGGKEVVEPTKDNPGSVTYTCKNDSSHTWTIPYCNQSDNGVHKVDVKRVEPTCTEDGKIIYTCTECDFHSEETIPAIKHGNGNKLLERTEPTCTQKGSEVYVCVDCGAVVDNKLIDATDHDFTGAWDIEDDEHVKHCLNGCGEEERAEHNYGDWIIDVEPTDTTPGNRYHVCDDCGHREDEPLSATGDDNTGDDDDDGDDTPTLPPVTIPDDDTPLGGGAAGAGAGADGVTITDEETPLAGTVGLNDADHFAYLIGYDDGTVRPLANLTRAEAVTIFFRLMTDEFRTANWSTENTFADVNAGKWYNNAISTCQKAGALEAFAQSGNFLPDQAITRAEFAALAAGFISDEYTGETVGDFSDTEGHWAAEYIRKAVEAGWIQGEGNSFRPDDTISRAEVVSMVNRMLDRIPDADGMLENMITWTDNVKGQWYYEDIQEATNSHEYERDEMGVVETWIALQENRDWAALEEEWAANGGAPAEAEENEAE